MSEFQDSSMAKLIRVITPMPRGREGWYDSWTLNWAILWTVIPIAGPMLLFEKYFTHTPWAMLLIFGVLVVVGALIFLISAAHGNLVLTDSSLTKSERQGAKQLQESRRNRLNRAS